MAHANNGNRETAKHSARWQYVNRPRPLNLCVIHFIALPGRAAKSNRRTPHIETSRLRVMYAATPSSVDNQLNLRSSVLKLKKTLGQAAGRSTAAKNENHLGICAECALLLAAREGMRCAAERAVVRFCGTLNRETSALWCSMVAETRFSNWCASCAKRQPDAAALCRRFAQQRLPLVINNALPTIS